MYPKYMAPGRPMGSAPFESTARRILTISYQYLDKWLTSHTPPINLYRFHECHHDHDEVEDQKTRPSYSKILGRAMSVEPTAHCTTALTPRPG